MSTDLFVIALISEVFCEADGAERLVSRLREAKAGGASLAILPELPLNPWSPATKNARDDDAEDSGGQREMIQREAAQAVGIGLIGGAIQRHANNGRRYNTALLIDSSGNLRGTYAKCHIPEEPGFWETSHYDAGIEPPWVCPDLGMPLGVQICSDINRPEGSHLLGAMGAELIAAPRATELATYQRWRPVFIANALTSCAFVVSVNRPSPEQDGDPIPDASGLGTPVLIGGPSIAVTPRGEVILETTDPVGIATLNRALIPQVRIEYPGYLPVRAGLYARAWAEIADHSS